MKLFADHKLSPWLTVRPASGRSLGNMLCFPFAGGGAAAFYRWTHLLLPDFNLVRINLPGREGRLREPLFTDTQSLVKRLSQELAFLTDEPFEMFGHSMGALIAFELCREFRRLRLALPNHLFVSGFWAPHLQPFDLPFSHLPDKEFLESVRQYGGLSEQVLQNKEIIEIFLPILRADYRIIETYTYSTELPLSCPITAYGGRSDPKVKCQQVLAWNMHTCATFDVHFFEGGHFFVQESESVIIDQINSRLKEAYMM